MKLGNKIKQLRTKKSLSQGQLADYLNVTAQAISKWESNTSFPDISQLPSLATFFCITIDELFDYPHDLEYERIDKMIENGHALTNDFFEHSENFLLEEIKKNPNHHRAISTLADLYHFHACRLNDKAIHYSLNALHLKPDNKFDLNTLNNASNGSINDWNISCHYKLIENLFQLVQNHPTHQRTQLFLLDNLIDDVRLEEAMDILNQSDSFELKDYYLIRIQEAKSGFEAVSDQYIQLVEHHQHWKYYMEVANRFAFHHQYEKAIEYYEKSFEVAPKPRYTDMLASIAYLYLCLKDNKKASQTFKRELQLLKDEWNITKGELVEDLQHKIDLLS